MYKVSSGSWVIAVPYEIKKEDYLLGSCKEVYLLRLSGLIQMHTTHCKGREKAQVGKGNSMFKYFLSCHKIGILFHQSARVEPLMISIISFLKNCYWNDGGSNSFGVCVWLWMLRRGGAHLGWFRTYRALEQTQRVISDPDRQEVILKGTASLVDWMKTTVGSVYPEKVSYLSPPVNTKAGHVRQRIRKPPRAGPVTIRRFIHWICPLPSWCSVSCSVVSDSWQPCGL